MRRHASLPALLLLLVGLCWPVAAGTRQDQTEATDAETVRLAAEQGDPDAQSRLGTMYRGEGLGVPQDHAQARRWLRLAAGQGHAYAQLGLGAMFMMGEGVDAAEALRWLHLAAAQDDPSAPGALYTLGVLYNAGMGVPRDHAHAALWLDLAAERGHRGAQINLGQMYAKGIGVAQDRVAAYMWLSIAAERYWNHDGIRERNPRLVQELDVLAEEMTPEQIAEAERRAQEWKPTPQPEP